MANIHGFPGTVRHGLACGSILVWILIEFISMKKAVLGFQGDLIKKMGLFTALLFSRYADYPRNESLADLTPR